MDQFQSSKKFQSERLLFIDKGYNEKDIPGYTDCCKVGNILNFH